MKRLTAIVILLSLLTGCRSSGVRGFWDDVDICVTSSNFDEAQDRFADFAELAVAAPTEEACAELDALLDKLRADEVSYYVYEEWMEGAFYNFLSPCRNVSLFNHALDRLLADGIMRDQMDRLLNLKYYNSINLKGQKCTIPPLHDVTGAKVEVPAGQATTILVVDASCRTCAAALSTLVSTEGRHVAICFGRLDPPQVPGWEYCFSSDVYDTFDTEAAPFYFTVDASGVVTTPYSPIPQPEFSTPQTL